MDIATKCQTHSKDVVEVVRCKDCKHSMDKHVTGYRKCMLLNCWLEDDAFCSYGERSEE